MGACNSKKKKQQQMKQALDDCNLLMGIIDKQSENLKMENGGMQGQQSNNEQFGQLMQIMDRNNQIDFSETRQILQNAFKEQQNK